MQAAKLHHEVQELTRMVCIIPGLQPSLLLSINKFADAKYITIFTPQDIKIFHDETMAITKTREPILQGWWDLESGLWCIPLIPQTTNPIISKHCNLHKRDYTKCNWQCIWLLRCKQVIKYLHAVAWYPTTTMWIKAINTGFFANKYFPESSETQKATCSNKGKKVIRRQTREVMVTTNKIKNIMYFSQTGKFLVVSSQDNRYIMVMSEKKNNLILRTMKTRASGKMCQAYNKLMECSKKRGIKVTKHILDNKEFREYLQEMKHTKISHQSYITEMQQKKQLEHSRINSKQSLQELTTCSPCTYGIGFRHRQKTSWTC